MFPQIHSYTGDPNRAHVPDCRVSLRGAAAALGSPLASSPGGRPYDASAIAKAGKHLADFDNAEVCDLLQDLGFDHVDINIVRMDRLTGEAPASLTACAASCHHPFIYCVVKNSPTLRQTEDL